MEEIIDLEDFELGWNNAPILENKHKDEFRMCFICKFHLTKKDIIKSFEQRDNNWLITLVNAKKPVVNENNLIAIHSMCMDNRSTMNYTKIIKKVKKMKWLFNEEFYKEK